MNVFHVALPQRLSVGDLNHATFWLEPVGFRAIFVTQARQSMFPGAAVIDARTTLS